MSLYVIIIMLMMAHTYKMVPKHPDYEKYVNSKKKSRGSFPITKKH